MSRGRLNPRRAKIHRSYSVAEAAVLFGVHRNTVRNWIRHGLPVVKTSSGLLILGRDFRPFLEQRQATRRRKCGPGELYCFKCSEPRRPRPGSLSVVQVTPTASSVIAQCEACGTRMRQCVGSEKLAALGCAGPSRQTSGLAPTR